ncbi:MAG: hypothetical protein AAF677_17180 [Pseudomonadota bacterium]
MTRDHDELPRVIACQERLQAAVDAMRAAMPGYDFKLEVWAAERPETAKWAPPVTCRLRETDRVPALVTAPPGTAPLGTGAPGTEALGTKALQTVPLATEAE